MKKQLLLYQQLYLSWFYLILHIVLSGAVSLELRISKEKKRILQISSAKITGFDYEEGDSKFFISVEFDVKYLHTFNAHEIYIKAFNSSGTLIGSDYYIRSGSESHIATFSGSVDIPINEKVSKIEISY